ncbi:MAG: hypothetical protein Q9160_000458 [Pyrenula sp. 1 TL-2023]
MDSKLVRELEKLDPSVPFRAKSPHLHHTWARTYYSRPEVYVQPQSVQEIQKVVTLARRCRRRLVAVGAAHSPSDLTCTSSWLINLDNFNRVLSINHTSRLVTCESGISLKQLGEELAGQGLSLPNLGSINNQSIAGAISTGTHGSSLRHGILSQTVRSISIVLANGQVVRCSKDSNLPLFKAALVSLGAIGIISEVTFEAVPDFNIEWRQSMRPLPEILDTWSSSLWTTAEYTRVWWMPYLRRAVLWRADKTDKPPRPPPYSFYGGSFGFHTYQSLLWLTNYIPSLLPPIEWLVFGLQYGFKPGKIEASAVEPGRTGLLMNCLYSQFVNEWAVPLEKGPEAIRRLEAWLHGDEVASGIPFSSKGVYIHAPVEVRVSDSSKADPRPFLDNTVSGGPTLYLNATLYRPYNRDPPCQPRYYEAFEYLMREMGAKPHWAKNFREESGRKLPQMYGKDMEEWVKIRNDGDPDGMFIGPWHRRNLCLGTPSSSSVEECKLGEESFPDGDGREWKGRIADAIKPKSQVEEPAHSPSPPMTTTSEESFDYLAKGEASGVLPKE